MAEPPSDPQPPSMMRTAAAFYGGATVVAFVWAGAAGRLPLWVGAPPTPESVARWTAAGVLFGLAMVIITALTKDLGPVRRMTEILGEVLGPVTWPQAFGLALLSGIGEELLFRGAIQPTLGLWPTTILFAVVHFPFRRELIWWTAGAGLLGLAFGLAFERSGHVAGPVVAHFVINFLNLRAVGRGD